MSADMDRQLRQYLVEHDVLEDAELAVAASVAELRGESLARALQRMELLPTEQLREHTAAAMGYALVDVARRRVDEELLSRLGLAFCQRHQVLPLAPEGEAQCSVLAMLNPGDVVLSDTIEQRLQGCAFDVCIADAAAIEQALYQQAAQGAVARVGTGDAIAGLEQLLAEAIAASASDIHLEPAADYARIRLRCDGVLRLWRHINLHHWQLLLGRIKVLAGMDIADSRSPQDGRFAHSSNGREVDLRASILPTDCGEAAVLRVLDRHRHTLDLAALGIEPEQRRMLSQLLAQPEGMLLICGPTGSGKSTTLYALVESIRGQSLNIISLEDPVEYPATWVRQSSIDDSVSMDYAAGVRAALRQDPDVMLIGEMRDAETAQMALRAAMTGHRVLSSLHANSALASVARLWDLGLSPKLLAGNLIGVVAQRLLRKLCSHCKVPQQLGALVYRAEGCQHCEHQGYRGRLAVLEIWPADGEFDELLHQGASRRAFEQLAQRKGVTTLRDAAERAVANGLTSEAELLRVLGPAQRQSKP